MSVKRLCFLVVVSCLFVGLLTGCSGSSDSPVQFHTESSAQTEGDDCPVTSCKIGVSYCDSSGGVRECVDGGDGCGVLEEPRACDGNLACYRGACVEQPEIAWPPDLEGDSKILEQSVGEVTVDHEPTVIPFEAFEAAYEGGRFAPTTREVAKDGGGGQCPRQ